MCLLIRKRLVLLSFIGALLCVKPALAEQLWPDADCSSLAGKTIRWIVPSKPGGGNDAYSRLLEPFLEHGLNARIVVENRSEAGGVVAALTLRDARPDGTTVGIINAPGLLTRHLVDPSTTPDIAQDLTVLGRIATMHYAIYSGKASGIGDFGELLRVSHTRPVVVAVRDVGSGSFLAIPVTASLLGLNYELVTGYVGTSSRVMALIRGEVDIIVSNKDSARPFENSGELIPLLRLSTSATSPGDQLPRLSGPQGVAQHLAPVTGRTVEQADQEAAALMRILELGRLVAAPPRLPKEISQCLGSQLHDALHNPLLLEAAQRAGVAIEPASREQVQSDLQASALDLARLEPLLKAELR